MFRSISLTCPIPCPGKHPKCPYFPYHTTILYLASNTLFGRCRTYHFPSDRTLYFYRLFLCCQYKKKKSIVYLSSFQTLQILGTTISTSFPAIHPSKTFPAILPSKFSSTKSPRIVRAEIVERWSLLKYFFLSSLEDFFVLTNTLFRLSRQDDFLYLSTSTTLEVVWYVAKRFTAWRAIVIQHCRWSPIFSSNSSREVQLLLPL